MPPPSNQESENLPPVGAIQFSRDDMLDLQDAATFDTLYPYVPSSKLVPAGTTSTENTIKLQHICDQRAIRPVYEFSGPQIGPFTATVRVGSQSFQTTTVVPSKKQAKEAVSKLAVLGLAPVNSEGVVGVKRKAADGIVEVDKTERWVAILHGKFLICQFTTKTF
jgi:hypothetical protein